MKTFTLESTQRETGIVVGHHSLVLAKGSGAGDAPELVPAVLWTREERGAEKQTLLLRIGPEGEDRTLDAGIIGSCALCRGMDDTLAAVWEKMDENGVSRLLFVQITGAFLGNINTVTTEGNPVAEVSISAGINNFLLSWSEIAGGNQIIKAAFSDDPGNPFILSNPRAWSSRSSSVFFRGNESARAFFVCWESYSGEGVSIEAAKVFNSGNIRRKTIFPPRGPEIRYLHPGVSVSGSEVLLSAVKIRNVISQGGVIDQGNTIVSAVVDPEHMEIVRESRPAVLNHGLLSDIEAGSGVWGYLGPRRQVRFLSEGTLFWERKEVHDGFTPAKEGLGVLCLSHFDREKREWGKELILHRGSYEYRLQKDGDRYWVLHRPVDQTGSQGLVLECLSGSESENPAEEWLNPEEQYQGFRVSFPREFSGEEGPPSGMKNESKRKLFWGDTHVHSKFSKDPEGEVDELLYYAREVAGLDFIAVTDNDEHYKSWLQRWERRRSADVCRAWHREGEFVVLDGFEYTQLRGGNKDRRNHRTVLLKHPTGRFFRWTDFNAERKSEDETLSEIEKRSEAIEALLIPHHNDWAISERENAAGIEAVSGWAAYFHDAEPVSSLWNLGRRVSLIGGSDNHRRNPGHGGALTGVWSEELTYSGIIQGISRGRTMASQGRRPWVSFFLEDERGKKVYPGDSAALYGAITAYIHIKVEEGTEDALELIELRHRQRVVANWSSCDCDEGGKCFRVSPPLGGTDSIKSKGGLSLPSPKYLYLRIRMNGRDREYPSNIASARGPWVWTSPVWWQ